MGDIDLLHQENSQVKFDIDQLALQKQEKEEAQNHQIENLVNDLMSTRRELDQISFEYDHERRSVDELTSDLQRLTVVNRGLENEVNQLRLTLQSLSGHLSDEKAANQELKNMIHLA